MEALAGLNVAQLRERARQEGCVPEEIEAARNTAEPMGSLTRLLIETSTWRTTELARQLAGLDQLALVTHAERTPSIGHADVERARDNPQPIPALVELLLSNTGFVVDQRRVHLHILSQISPYAKLRMCAGAASFGALGGAIMAGCTIGAPVMGAMAGAAALVYRASMPDGETARVVANGAADAIPVVLSVVGDAAANGVGVVGDAAANVKKKVIGNEPVAPEFK